MIDSKFGEYEKGNTGIGLATCDKQALAPVKKTALRDLQNDNRTVLPKPLENSPAPKDAETTKNVIKLLGAKRPTPDRPLSPSRPQSLSSNGANGHLVYVRRKSEAEPGKNSAHDNDHSADYPESRQLGQKGDIPQQAQMKEPKGAGFSTFSSISAAPTTTSSGVPSVPIPLGKPVNGPHGANSAVSCSENSQDVANMHWGERLIQLEAYLKDCDHSNQEAYVQKLRSFTSAERSRHAVELEKRAIRLFLEEGRELERIKALNVLGKYDTKNVPPQLTPPTKSDN